MDTSERWDGEGAAARIAALEAENQELRRALEASRETESRLAMFLDSQATPVTYLGLDGTILVVNDAAARNIGGTPESVVGKSIYAVFPDQAEQTRERITQGAASQSGITVDGSAELASGRRWFRSIYSPVRNATGGVFAVQLISQDITEIKRTEHELAETERELTIIFEHSPYIIAMLERDSTIRYINRVVDGYRMEDVVGSHGRDHLQPEYQAAYRDAIEAVFTRRESTLFDFEDVLGRVWESRIVPVERDGTVEHALSFAVDVTEQHAAAQRERQLEAQLQHAQKLESLGILAGGIAHDFNNLLVGILINAELALGRSADGRPVEPQVQGVIESARRAAELCRQMLAYSGRGRFVVTRLDLSQAVEEMGDLLTASISKRARLRWQLDRDLPMIEADAAQLGQVVMNLITNASDALALAPGDAGGEIFISSGRRHIDAAQACVGLIGEPAPGEYVYFQVQDGGSGMDGSTRQRMFEPFFTSKQRGRGLGLAAVLGIVRGHSGAIEVESAPGAGTRVAVLFPAAGESAEPGVTPSHRPRADVGGADRRLVLVVDDERHVREASRAVLADAGYRVETASGGEQALSFYRAHGPEVSAILLDMTMPGTDGRATLAALRALDIDARVVLTSGYDESEAASTIGHGEHTAFLPKPSGVDEMLRAVERVRR